MSFECPGKTGGDQDIEPVVSAPCRLLASSIVIRRRSDCDDRLEGEAERKMPVASFQLEVDKRHCFVGEQRAEGHAPCVQPRRRRLETT